MKYSNLNELHFQQSTQSLDIIEKANIIAKRCNDTFTKGLITESEIEKAFTALDNQLKNDFEKARITKYFKREGSPGNYKYYYTEAEYKKAKGKKKPTESTSKDSKGSKGFDWNSEDAKILAKHGITKDNLQIGGYLDLRETKITSLPDNLKVGRYLNLYGTQITSLPDNLKVGRYLNLRGTQITSLPDNLEVGGTIYMDKPKDSGKHNIKYV